MRNEKFTCQCNIILHCHNSTNYILYPRILNQFEKQLEISINQCVKPFCFFFFSDSVFEQLDEYNE